jgi:2-polyprenyl-6-methoxyphenol hydroxylase-like FAD-dependent oxidoreductase
MCTEDAVVLAELVTSRPVEQALPAFMARRLPRVELVVRHSRQLVRWEMNLEPHTDADFTATMSTSLGFLAAQPA